MREDMARWIEAAAEKGHDEECESEYRWKDLREGQRGMIRDMVRRDVMNVLQAAAADGVKLTPHDETEAMEDERDRLWEGDNIEGIWRGVWRAAPNYLEE